MTRSREGEGKNCKSSEGSESTNCNDQPCKGMTDDHIANQPYIYIYVV